MITQEQCLEKLAEMADQVKGHIIEKATQLLRSGAVNLPDWENNYVLPKILLVACLEYEADQWRPLKENRLARKTIAKLGHF